MLESALGESNPGQRWHLWALLLAAPVVLVLIGGAVIQFGGGRGGEWGCSADRPLIFERDRAKADEIAAWARVHGDSDDYYTDLPSSLAAFAACGMVSVYTNSVFVAQWGGVPDDAGGFWYSPRKSPEGYDMWGMICRSPIDLGGGWWECGMAP